LPQWMSPMPRPLNFSCPEYRVLGRIDSVVSEVAVANILEVNDLLCEVAIVISRTTFPVSRPPFIPDFDASSAGGSLDFEITFKRFCHENQVRVRPFGVPQVHQVLLGPCKFVHSRLLTIVVQSQV